MLSAIQTSEEAKAAMVVRPEEERFYVIVPEVVTPIRNHNYPMEHGRLIAQAHHVGRLVERDRVLQGIPLEDITTIALAARNSRELEKVWAELVARQAEDNSKGLSPFKVTVYRDHNPEIYATDDRVLTAITVGPVAKSRVDSILGHLDTY